MMTEFENQQLDTIKNHIEIEFTQTFHKMGKAMKKLKFGNTERSVVTHTFSPPIQSPQSTLAMTMTDTNAESRSLLFSDVDVSFPTIHGDVDTVKMLIDLQDELRNTLVKLGEVLPAKDTSCDNNTRIKFLEESLLTTEKHLKDKTKELESLESTFKDYKIVFGVQTRELQSKESQLIMSEKKTF